MNTDPRPRVTATAPSESIVTVNIFGAEYAIRASADPEYIRRMATHVDGLMREISARVQHASAARIAVLAALQMADQLITERQSTRSGRQALAEQTDLLLSRLDQTLLEVVE